MKIASLWHSIETGIYNLVGCILAATALLALASCVPQLIHGVSSWTSEDAVYPIIDRLLLVLMLVEILHTVRISIRSHTLEPEPFLVLGLIATVRRMLLIALEAANLSHSDAGNQSDHARFIASVAELAGLGFLLLAIVIAICLLRRYPSPSEPPQAV